MPADPRIDAYIAAAAPFAQPILTHLRKLIHAASPEITEAFKWSHPTYLYRDKMLCGTHAFKAHATLGFWHQDMEKLLAKEIGKTYDAMGMLGRLTSIDDLPDDKTMLRYFKTAISLYDEGVPSKPKPKPKPPLKTPADLESLLAKNKAAATTWEKFSPSHRRDYIEWITEAKRPETRATRLETTLTWLKEGKSRNWKYENC